MFVDPNQMQKMQKDLQKRGGAASLTLNQGGRDIRCQLTSAETTIGTNLECDIPIKGFLVKKIHAQILVSDSHHRLIAFGRLRPVRVNGSKVDSVVLQSGDQITIAGTSLVYNKA